MNDKNLKIAKTFKQTKEKRNSQVCKAFRFKVDQSSLSREQSELLKMMFVESKWVYNYLLTVEDIFSFDYRELTTVTRKDREGNLVPTEIRFLGSSIRQALVGQIQTQIKGLSVLKKHGHQVGGLKFKSEFNSIPLKQYGTTHKISGTSKFKIQGIKKPIRVNGLKQLDGYSSIDYANARLIYDGYDYFVSLTCYIDKPEPVEKPAIGIDMGCRTAVTLSDGTKFYLQVGESGRLKKLQAKLARQQKRSNNWKKTRSQIRKEYNHITNQRKDRANKILNYLDRYTVVMQDEQLDSWKTDLNSKKIQHSALGRIKKVLMSRPDTVILDQWFPTTRYCSACGCKNSEMTLSDREFYCPECGLREDRDVHAANNMLYFYDTNKDGLGTSRTSKPVRIRFQAGRHEASASC